MLQAHEGGALLRHFKQKAREKRTAQFMTTKSFKNELFWSQIGFEVTYVTAPPRKRFE